MSLSQQARLDIADALGTAVTAAAPVTGGSINDAYELTLGDGREVFVKTHDRPPPGMYQAEARGLQWLAEADAIAVPDVVLVTEEFLVLSFIQPGHRVPDFEQRLGRALAELHGFGAPAHGLSHDNFIGSLPQDNAPCPTWAEFYAKRRLRPQVRAARDAGHVDMSFVRMIDSLCDRLPSLVGLPEPPARLHGDLWGGNLHITENGRPCLIDPAVYGGHREMDLAMMQLFGGFSGAVFAAYNEAFPLEPDWRTRVPLYQLYPLLVHVNLFGGGYVGQARTAANQYI